MNLVGYYDSEEVWIPDPYLMEKERSELNNQYPEVKYQNLEDSPSPREEGNLRSSLSGEKYSSLAPIGKTSIF